MNASRFGALRAQALQWLPELGIGWYPVTEAPYDAAYWERYRLMDETPAGARLTADRCAWVRQHAGPEPGVVCDVGIGGGRFVQEFGARGCDVNPSALAWLEQCGRLHDLRGEGADVATFWDSLEHIHDPVPLLAGVRRWVFTSLPIFSGPDHVLRSKHYRRDEHCWYFTREGLALFMGLLGFELRGVSVMEQNAGREDIGTFAFERVKHA